MKLTSALLLVLLAATSIFAGEKEDVFAKKLQSLYEARDIEGLLALVEFGDGNTPRFIHEMKRKSFEFVAKAKILHVTIEKLTAEEQKEFAAPFDQQGVTYVPALTPIAKAVIAFEDVTPGPMKILSVTQPLGIKGCQYRIVTAMAEKKPN